MAHSSNSFSFADHLVKIPTEQLAVGMFIYDLDCDWERTPFDSNGFCLQRVEDINLLSVLCKKVTIDVKRGIAPSAKSTYQNNGGIAAPAKSIFGINKNLWTKKAKKAKIEPERPKRSVGGQANPAPKPAKPAKLAPAANSDFAAKGGVQKPVTILSNARSAVHDASRLKLNRDKYGSNQSMRQGVDKASWNYRKLQRAYQLVCWQVRRRGTVNLTILKTASKGVTTHILENPHSYVWLLNTETRAQTRTTYCVRAAIWATILARQFGLSRQNIEALFLGTLLCDVGLNLLPKRLINKRGSLSKEEHLAYQKHVELSLKLVAQQPGLDERITEIVRFHHERQDGRGYPHGRNGNQIPPLARFANVAYCFERQLRTNHPGVKVSPVKAINRLYNKRGLNFSEQMALEFIHALGTYPVGTLVELSTGELGLVVEQNGKARLYPKVAILYAANGVKLAEPVLVDLAMQSIGLKKRSITASAKFVPKELNLGEYTFRFWGKRVGVGPFGLRL